MQHAKDLKRLASEASSKIEKKTNFDEATKLRGMIMSLGLVSRLSLIFFVCFESQNLSFSTHFGVVGPPVGFKFA